MRLRCPVSAFGALLIVVSCTSCGRLQARQAFKDGNKQYKDEHFKQAIDRYEEAVQKNPGMAEAWFYLGSSHQALNRPGKNLPENKEHLDKAIDAYKKSLEANPSPHGDNLKKVRVNTLGALIQIYSDDPYRDFDVAYGYANQLVQENPNDTKNLYALANLYKKFEKVEQAEETYRKIAETNPNDTKACGALAGFYNEPLWNGRSKFEQAIEVLQRCAALDPNDAGGWQKVATFYWDKAYRDPVLSDEQKNQYADKGLEAVDKALALKPEYFEAVIYKNLLFRVKASVTKDPRLKQQYIDQALALQKQGLELKKQQAEAAAAAAAGGTPTAAASPSSP
jgi:tetratricopeptide (TPR) repeat protein